jgi:5'-nucleotidase
LLILLTNDDGIYAEGIQMMSRFLTREHQVYVVAPDHEQSATGHAITMHRPLRAEKIEHMYGDTKGAWAVNGTPSDCVKLAVEALLKEDPPQLVISGINRGYNLGTDVLYSGTVSAAVEAVILDLPAIAVSVGSASGCPNFSLAASFTADLIQNLEIDKIDKNTVLNLNFPDIDEKDIKGVRITSQGVRHYRNSFEKRVDPRGRTYYWLAGELMKKDNLPDSDVVAVEQGFISLTPLQFNLSHEGMMEKLKNREIPWRR